MKYLNNFYKPASFVDDPAAKYLSWVISLDFLSRILGILQTMLHLNMYRLLQTHSNYGTVKIKIEISFFALFIPTRPLNFFHIFSDISATRNIFRMIFLLHVRCFLYVL